MGPQQGDGLAASAPAASSVPIAEHPTAAEGAESAAPYDVSVEQAGPYRGNAPATAPPRDSTEDIDLDLRPDDSLALPPPPIRTAAAPGWHSPPPPEREGRTHTAADTAAASAGGSGAADGESAGGGRARSPSDDQESPSKRSSALDVTGAAIIKSVPGEGAARHLCQGVFSEILAR